MMSENEPVTTAERVARTEAVLDKVLGVMTPSVLTGQVPMAERKMYETEPQPMAGVLMVCKNTQCRVNAYKPRPNHDCCPACYGTPA